VESEVSDLRQALYRGDRDAADALLAEGVAVNVFDAAALGDVAYLRWLLAADPDLAHDWSADGFTALHFAAFLGGANVVRVLIDAGADVSAVARNEMLVQPLHSAAALGDVVACDLLLDAGADPNAPQQGGFVPLDEALIKKNEPLANLLRSRGAKLSGNPLPQ
jgi:ankyrin repeat protein